MVVVPLWAVAVAFSLASLACFWDMFSARIISMRVFRLFEGLIVAMAGYYYWQSEIHQTIPSINLRFVWLGLCMIIIAEIISRQSWGTKAK